MTAIALVSVMDLAATDADLPVTDKVAALVVTDPVVLAAPVVMDPAVLAAPVVMDPAARVVMIAKAIRAAPLAGRMKLPPSAQSSLLLSFLTTPNSNYSAGQ